MAGSANSPIASASVIRRDGRTNVISEAANPAADAAGSDSTDSFRCVFLLSVGATRLQPHRTSKTTIWMTIQQSLSRLPSIRARAPMVRCANGIHYTVSANQEFR